MNYIKNLPIKQKLFLVSIIPVIALILMAFILISNKYEELQSYKKLEILMTLNANISYVVHESQKERGASAGYIESKGEKFSDILSKQKYLTNEKLNFLEDYIKSSNVKSILNKTSLNELNNIFKELSKLDKVREDVINLEFH